MVGSVGHIVDKTIGQTNENIVSKAREKRFRRSLPNSVGAYIDATVSGGASPTILSKKIYDKIPSEKRPKLKQSVHNITCAGGSVLKEHGKAVFDLQLGALLLTKELIIADIGDEGLLGADIIQEDERGPRDLMLSRGVLKLGGWRLGY